MPRCKTAETFDPVSGSKPGQVGRAIRFRYDRQNQGAAVACRIRVYGQFLNRLDRDVGMSANALFGVISFTYSHISNRGFYRDIYPRGSLVWQFGGYGLRPQRSHLAR